MSKSDANDKNTRGKQIKDRSNMTIVFFIKKTSQKNSQIYSKQNRFIIINSKLLGGTCTHRDWIIHTLSSAHGEHCSSQ